MTTLPTGPFATIVADPPWPYANAGDGSAFQRRELVDGSRRMRSVTEWTYEPMPMEQILSLPVGEVAADNAHLYLWVTNAFMDEGHDVVRAWGFEPKSIVTWVKMQHGYPPQVSMKMGFYFRGATEHAIFGVRGSLRPPAGVALPTAFLWERLPQHSSKPHEFYREVAEVMSPGPRLEMFARGPRHGWTVWGDQIEDPDRPAMGLA